MLSVLNNNVSYVKMAQVEVIFSDLETYREYL